MNYKHDIIVVGSGLVGMALALILSKKKIDVTIIEKNSKSELLKHRDLRTSAISQGSSRILSKIGVWQKIITQAQPINEIKVSEGNDFKGIEFKSSLLGEGPLGYIVNNHLLKKIFYKELFQSKYIKFIDNVKIKGISSNTHNVTIDSNKGKFSTTLVVGADGRYSEMRYLANIKYLHHDYKQIALVFNIKHSQSHNATALEMFYPSGPLALLPMIQNKGFSSSVVWTMDDYKKEEYLNKKTLRDDFDKKYLNVFGAIKEFSTPVVYNLNLFSCYDYFKERVVLIGDACQAIHPIAGQGLNLGLRDSYELSKSILSGYKLGLDCGSDTVLRNYAQTRIIDRSMLITATHRLNQLFSNNSLFFKKLRENGLKIFNKSNFLKKQSMLFAMGLKHPDF